MNLLGFLGAASRVLPGYLQGYRMAIDDNWKDLNQYNQVWKGQLSNLFDEATFEPAVDMFNSNADISQFNLLNTGLQTATNLVNTPGAIQQGWVNSAFAPQNAMFRNQALNSMYRNMINGGALAGVSAGGNAALTAIDRQIAALQAQRRALEAQGQGQPPSGVQ